jgi:DNA-binding beta-propeller fold protein YncE
MNSIVWQRKAWLCQLLLAGVIVWLGYGLLVESGKISNSTYAGPAQGQADRKSVVIDRPPLRFIKDPNPSFSAVAVNSENNMLVVADENLFNVLEYDRRDNTPPQARFTEPKRIVGGTATRMEMMCGVYIDPKTREIYVLNNDTQPWLPVFSPDAKGNVKPTRFLAGIRGFSLAANEERQELYVVNQEDNAVYVYRKQAEGEEKPLRILRGPDTLMADPHGIALDTKNNVMFVSNFGSAQVTDPKSGRSAYGTYKEPTINVYPLLAMGNTKPLRVIEGPKARLNWPAHMALHEERQELFVANDADDSVLVFRASDQGDVAPIRVIKGSNTGILHPPGIALDSKLNELYVASMGNASVTVFPVDATGNVKPTRTIRGAPAGAIGLNIGNPGAVGYDTKRQQVLVPN